MLSTLAVQLFTHEGINTTEAKAKALRPYAEKLIELGFTLKDGGHEYDPSASGVYFSGGDE